MDKDDWPLTTVCHSHLFKVIIKERLPVSVETSSKLSWSRETLALFPEIHHMFRSASSVKVNYRDLNSQEFFSVVEVRGPSETVHFGNSQRRRILPWPGTANNKTTKKREARKEE